MPEELLISSWVDCYNGEVGYELQPADVKSDARGISLISFISIAKDRSIISSSKSTVKQIQFTRRYRFCLAIDIWQCTSLLIYSLERGRSMLVCPIPTSQISNI